MEQTLNNLLSPAEVCRRNGWRPGTKLIGDEGYGPHTIEITAVGVHSILARCIAPCGDSLDQLWSLEGRDWKLVE